MSGRGNMDVHASKTDVCLFGHEIVVHVSSGRDSVSCLTELTSESDGYGNW